MGADAGNIVTGQAAIILDAQNAKDDATTEPKQSEESAVTQGVTASVPDAFTQLPPQTHQIHSSGSHRQSLTRLQPLKTPSDSALLGFSRSTKGPSVSSSAAPAISQDSHTDAKPPEKVLKHSQSDTAAITLASSSSSSSWLAKTNLLPADRVEDPASAPLSSTESESSIPANERRSSTRAAPSKPPKVSSTPVLRRMESQRFSDSWINLLVPRTSGGKWTVYTIADVVITVTVQLLFLPLLPFFFIATFALELFEISSERAVVTEDPIIRKYTFYQLVRNNRLRVLYIPFTKKPNPIVFVLVHGFNGNIDMWAEQIKYFSQFGSVIAAETVGHGKSEKSLDWRDYTLDSTLSDLTWVISNFSASASCPKPSKFVFIAHSYGCIVTTFLVKRVASIIHRSVESPKLSVVLIGPPLRLTNPSQSLSFQFLLRLPNFVLDTLRAFDRLGGPQHAKSVTRSLFTPSDMSLLTTEQKNLRLLQWKWGRAMPSYVVKRCIAGLAIATTDDYVALKGGLSVRSSINSPLVLRSSEPAIANATAAGSSDATTVDKNVTPAVTRSSSFSVSEHSSSSGPAGGGKSSLRRLATPPWYREKVEQEESAGLEPAKIFIIVGDHDQLTPPSRARALNDIFRISSQTSMSSTSKFPLQDSPKHDNATLPTSTSDFLVVPEAGHQVMLEKAGQVNSVIKTFLKLKE